MVANMWVQLSSLGWRTRLSPPAQLRSRVDVEREPGWLDDVGKGSRPLHPLSRSGDTELPVSGTEHGRACGPGALPRHRSTNPVPSSSRGSSTKRCSPVRKEGD